MSGVVSGERYIDDNICMKMKIDIFVYYFYYLENVYWIFIYVILEGNNKKDIV